MASRRSIAGAVVVVALCAIYLKWPDGALGRVTYLTVTIGASAVAWISVRRFGGSSRVWLAVGISASALGDGIYEVYVSSGVSSPTCRSPTSPGSRRMSGSASACSKCCAGHTAAPAATSTV